jgi:hypothetical protein
VQARQTAHVIDRSKHQGNAGLLRSSAVNRGGNGSGRALAIACTRGKISTIEPHPMHDGIDVMTYQRLVHGDIWQSVLNGVEAETEIAKLLPTMV